MYGTTFFICIQHRNVHWRLSNPRVFAHETRLALTAYLQTTVGTQVGTLHSCALYNTVGPSCLQAPKVTSLHRLAHMQESYSS